MNELQTVTERPLVSIFGNVDSFELAQRAANALASSTIIPKDFQGNVGNCLIALELAHRLSISPFIVLQSLYIVHGKPSFSASFIIAQINSSGRYAESLQFKIEGKGDDKQCVAWTIDKNGVIQEGPAVSIRMAKVEGWYQRNGSKWQTIPELMLRYRAATWFGRLYVPELLLGMQSQEELEDIRVIDVTPQNQNINDAIAEKQKQAQEIDEKAPPRKKRKYTRRKPKAEQVQQNEPEEQDQEIELKEKPVESAAQDKPTLELIQSAFDNAKTKEHIGNVLESLKKYVFSDEEQEKIDELAQSTYDRIDFESAYSNQEQTD